MLLFVVMVNSREAPDSLAGGLWGWPVSLERGRRTCLEAVCLAGTLATVSTLHPPSSPGTEFIFLLGLQEGFWRKQDSRWRKFFIWLAV